MHRLKENLIPNQTSINYHLEFNHQFGDFNQLSDAKYTESINQLASDRLIPSKNIKTQNNNEYPFDTNSNQYAHNNSHFTSNYSSDRHIQIPSIELIIENQEKRTRLNSQFKTITHQLAELFSNKPYLSSKQVIILNPNEQNIYDQNSIFVKKDPMKQGYIYPIEQNVANEQQSLISLNNFPSDQDIEYHNFNIIGNMGLDRKTTLDKMNLKDKNDNLSTTSPQSDRIKQQNTNPQDEIQRKLKLEIAQKKQQNKKLQIISQILTFSSSSYLRNQQRDQIDWYKLKWLLEIQMSSRKMKLPFNQQ